MAGDVVNIKVCFPLKLRSGLTGKNHTICHYSYNLPLCAIRDEKSQLKIRNLLYFSESFKIILWKN